MHGSRSGWHCHCLMVSFKSVIGDLALCLPPGPRLSCSPLPQGYYTALRCSLHKTLPQDFINFVCCQHSPPSKQEGENNGAPKPLQVQLTKMFSMWNILIQKGKHTVNPHNLQWWYESEDFKIMTLTFEHSDSQADNKHSLRVSRHWQHKL